MICADDDDFWWSLRRRRRPTWSGSTDGTSAILAGRPR